MEELLEYKGHKIYGYSNKIVDYIDEKKYKHFKKLYNILETINTEDGVFYKVETKRVYHFIHIEGMTGLSDHTLCGQKLSSINQGVNEAKYQIDFLKSIL